jgi:hypothetical protein
MIKSLVDIAWTCTCGALNAGSRSACGLCNITNDSNKIKTELNEEE